MTAPQKYLISLASRGQRVAQRREESNETSKEHLDGALAKCYIQYISLNLAIGTPYKMQDAQYNLNSGRITSFWYKYVPNIA